MKEEVLRMFTRMIPDNAFGYFFRVVKNSSNLITFAGFLLLSMDGFIFTSKLGSQKPKVPLRSVLDPDV